ncbi:PD-(D/E)XK nuclease family protein [Candidatus Saccharibacteria bacterium]|nr:PD-(D/E)XK nuclease family protein [Candidatus Saccharibacteria bacterium]
MDNDEKFFIINKMYAGSYLDENDSQNIGHEVINLFSDDNGDNYIYINPSGIIAPKYNDKVEYVFLTKQYDRGCQEVLGVAKVGQQLIRKPEKKDDEPIEQQAAEYKNKVKYYGQSLTRIFKNNTYNGGEDGYFDNPVLTFKTEEFYLPKQDRRILIAEKDSSIQEDGATICRLSDYNFGHQSLRFYFSDKDEKTKNAFRSLEQLIGDETLFDKRMPSKIAQADIDQYGKEVTSYLEIMGKINSENIYSNLLSYFLKTDRNLLAKFCKEICGVDIQKDEAKVEREKHGRTDIWIEDDNNNVIVIENKIDAELSRPEQLKDYSKKAHEEARGRKVTLLLIAPNHYSKIKLDENGCYDGFKMIRYSQIHKVLEDYQYRHSITIKGEDEDYIKKINLYYSDFLRALSIHGKSEKSADQESTERLFYKKLYLLSKNKKD